MNIAITVSLVINAALGVGWIARTAPTPPAWPLDAMFDSVRLQFHERTPCGEPPPPWKPTQIAIRIEDSELALFVYGSLDAPESPSHGEAPVIYVYPDANVTVGDVVAALDKIEELAPTNTIVVTELTR